MQPKPIRIGFVGAGAIARQRHLPGLRAIDGVELVAVANRTRASSERVASEWGFPDVCDDWRDLVQSGDIDAVFNGTPPYLHCEATLAALDAGKHVFCQARMARDYAEARMMHSLGIVGTLKSGAIAVLDVSGSTQFAGSPRIELFGSDGTMVYEVRGDRIFAARHGESELRQVQIAPEEQRHWTAEADFIAAIREGTPVTPDFEEGLRYMEVTEAIYRAARTGRMVALPL